MEQINTYSLRRSRLLNILRKEKLDGLLIMKPVNRYYLSGFRGSAGMIVFTGERALLLTDFRYEEQARQQASDWEIVRYQGDPLETLRNVLQEMKVTRLGFEEDYVTCGQLKTFIAKLDQVSFIGLEDPVGLLRAVKDPDEIMYIKQAAFISDQAFLHILDIIRPGLKEIDIAAELEYLMRKLGSEGPAFETIVASGFRSSLPHGAASEKRLAEGDMIVMDFGAVYQGYHSDLTRTVVLGKATSEQKRIYQLVLRAQEAGLQSVMAGASCNEIDALARGIIAGEGYGPYFGHSLGHGVGLEIHEHPRLTEKNEKKLQAGMIVTVEPGIYLPDWGGVRIEDLVLVKEKGCQVLSQAPKELIELA
ncbi:MAG: M24 family metallopeptidase [Bacillota bacterium]|jgi:Xaa-Pro aminopeptidase